MIITKTPFRISFFGGGTDYPSWYLENSGSVLATSIDKYCYISCRPLPQFFEHKHRIVYSAIENIKSIEEVNHPAVRAVFQWANIKDGLEVHHDADLPARAGLGSSSSFTVGLVHALKALDGQVASKDELARAAIHIEQRIIKEHVGSQDQVSAAFGGLNRIDFLKNGEFKVSPITIAQNRIDNLNDHMMLFFTGVTRFASEIAEHQLKNMAHRKKELTTMHEMVDEAISILHNSKQCLDDFGKLLNESWKYKRSLSDQVSTSTIDAIYQTAINAGALGGKILGAGGGGFLLIFAHPEDQPRIKKALANLVYVPFKFERSGSSIALYQPQGL